jgi:hypothetical protein
MSYHYPHHVGTTAAPERANSAGAEAASRHSQITGHETKKILTFRRAAPDPAPRRMSGDDGLRPKLDSFIRNREGRSGVNWREGAAVAGGILVLLITVWLIWAALAEAALAAADTA